MDVPEFAMETYEPTTGSFGRITLSEVRKAGLWTVLVFYPADFTFVCPTELADLAEKHAEIEAMGVKIVAISSDTKFAHLAWRNSEKLLENVKYTMGADPTGRVSRMFGVYDEASGEWIPAAEAAVKAAAADTVEVRDSVGNLLQDGDQVTLIKDLTVKGAGQTLKRGTLIKSIRLTGDAQEIDCKFDGIKGLVLRAEFVRKR